VASANAPTTPAWKLHRHGRAFDGALLRRDDCRYAGQCWSPAITFSANSRLEQFRRRRQFLRLAATRCRRDRFRLRRVFRHAYPGAAKQRGQDQSGAVCQRCHRQGRAADRWSIERAAGRSTPRSIPACGRSPRCGSLTASCSAVKPLAANVRRRHTRRTLRPATTFTTAQIPTTSLAAGQMLRWRVIAADTLSNQTTGRLTSARPIPINTNGTVAASFRRHAVADVSNFRAELCHPHQPAMKRPSIPTPAPAAIYTTNGELYDNVFMRIKGTTSR